MRCSRSGGYPGDEDAARELFGQLDQTKTREDFVAAANYIHAAVPEIRAELVLHFAETDERINAAWPAYEAALQAAGVSYRVFTYPGTEHGFNNDTTPCYDQTAADLAWSRTIEAFENGLRRPGWRTRLNDWLDRE